MGFAGNTSEFYTTPFPHRPGDKGRDKDGNEYLFVSFTGNVYVGTLVQITADYTASALLGTARDPYRVGIVCGGQAVSNNALHGDTTKGGWVQIYGMFYAAQTGSASGGLASDGTVEYFAVAQTSVGTPSGTFSLITAVAGTSIEITSTDSPRIWGLWVLPPTQVSNLGTAAGSAFTVPTVAQFGASVSDTSGPVSVGTFFGKTSGDNTSAFIGQTYAVFLNYPWCDGNAMVLGAGTT
jgi:hypothetical protein